MLIQFYNGLFILDNQENNMLSLSQDVDVERPDERSVMTYVAQFLHKYPELRSDTGDTLSAVQAEFNELIQWLMERNNSLEHMRQTNSLPTNYMVRQHILEFFFLTKLFNEDFV